LSEALQVPIDYFFRDSNIKLCNVEFRKKSKFNKKDIQQIKEFVIDYLERYIEIERILNVRYEFTNPLEKIVINKIDDIEIASQELRRNWEIGMNPVLNLIEMLEDKGVKIVEIDADQSFDGLATWVENFPVIVVNKNIDLVRKRFTVVHELAHLLLSFSENLNEKSIEKLCHNFAGAFLLPEVSLKNYLGVKRSHISIQELIDIKEYFGISIQAIVYRLFNLNIISKDTFDEFFIKLNKENQRDESNLGKYIGEESSSRFERLVLKAASEEIITFSKASQLLNKDLEEFRRGFQVF
jgi:Zn-dependent peptidase ImmA (M78 family)